MTLNRKPPSGRTPGKDVPELKEYLKPDAKVLDVGCGRGTIARDVAAAIYPGALVGIDPSEEFLSSAREWATQTSHAVNISFRVGDTYNLDFPDEIFDLVYSQMGLYVLLDPVSALKEQKRVTKKDSWVIAGGVRDHLISLRQPPCLNWDETWRAGRKCAQWFSMAGLKDARFRVKTERLQFFRAETMTNSGLDLLLLNRPESSQDEQLVLILERTIAAGLLDRVRLERAKEEARSWYKDPCLSCGTLAFHFWINVFAAGRA